MMFDGNRCVSNSYYSQTTEEILKHGIIIICAIRPVPGTRCWHISVFVSSSGSVSVLTKEHLADVPQALRMA